METVQEKAQEHSPRQGELIELLSRAPARLF